MKSFFLQTRLVYSDPCLAQLVMGKMKVLVQVEFTPLGILVQVPGGDTLVNDGQERLFALPLDVMVDAPADLHLLMNCLHPEVVRNIVLKCREKFTLSPAWGETWLKTLLSDHKPNKNSNKEVSPPPPPVY